jgi:hypothetical protein
MCTVHYCSSRTKISICYFFWTKTTTYFVLKNYTLIEYNILDIIIFFFGIFEVLKFKFLEFQISMELELQTSAFIKGNYIPSLNTSVLMNSLLCITPIRLLHFTRANVGSKVKKNPTRSHSVITDGILRWGSKSAAVNINNEEFLTFAWVPPRTAPPGKFIKRYNWETV